MLAGYFVAIPDAHPVLRLGWQFARVSSSRQNSFMARRPITPAKAYSNRMPLKSASDRTKAGSGGSSPYNTRKHSLCTVLPAVSAPFSSGHPGTRLVLSFARFRIPTPAAHLFPDRRIEEPSGNLEYGIYHPQALRKSRFLTELRKQACMRNAPGLRQSERVVQEGKLQAADPRQSGGGRTPDGVAGPIRSPRLLDGKVR